MQKFCKVSIKATKGKAQTMKNMLRTALLRLLWHIPRRKEPQSLAGCGSYPESLKIPNKTKKTLLKNKCYSLLLLLSFLFLPRSIRALRSAWNLAYCSGVKIFCNPWSYFSMVSLSILGPRPRPPSGLLPSRPWRICGLPPSPLSGRCRTSPLPIGPPGLLCPIPSPLGPPRLPPMNIMA